MDDTIDLLQIKIEKAKAQLSEDTLNAINAVPWRDVILGLRERKGYNFEQLGDLELETELVLCGLLNPEDYPRELENRMHLSKSQVNELVKEMNEKVFAKIKEELIKNTERKKIFARNQKNDNQVLDKAGITVIEPSSIIPDIYKEKIMENREEMLRKIEKPEEMHPLLAQKLSSSFQIPAVKTQYSLDNITKTSMLAGPGGPNPVNDKPKIPSIDPYREIPE